MNDLNSLGWKIHGHLKTHRPNMFRELKKQGRLKRYVLSCQEYINDMLTSLEEQGLYPHEALELMRDEIYCRQRRTYRIWARRCSRTQTKNI